MPEATSLRLPPGVLYPERREPEHTWLTRLENTLVALALSATPAVRRRRASRIARLVEAQAEEVASLRAERWRAEVAQVGNRLRREGFRREPVARAFALVREAAHRHLGLRHYPTQLQGGFIILSGAIAEMETGEGKTLTATLAAATAALSGTAVHVITVNSYLAARDADLMRPVYEALGLSVGTVVEGMAPEARRAAYACNITYCTNKDVAFDHMRDRLTLGSRARNLPLKLERLRGSPKAEGLLMRGLPFAIVDEADSVLIDEARTPLIISGTTEPTAERLAAEQAIELVASLTEPEHYRVHKDERRIELTNHGREALAEIGRDADGPWTSRIRRDEAASQALSARHLFSRDEHYVVRDGKIEIVDEYTGRIMADRAWSDGLHQIIEVKEGVEVTGRRVPLARMTYQRFFRRYCRLGGMSGTAAEVTGELWAVYRLPVQRVAPHRPLRRRKLASRVVSGEAEKWRQIAIRADELARSGRPVLIGTRSIDASMKASAALHGIGTAHVVLNATQNKDEAAIIAEAGEAGRVTVATNMAGRGVDIAIPPPVVAKGGLHVLLSERHDAGRIDRQFAGRCARQGQPGDTEEVLSLDDPLLESLPRSLIGVVKHAPDPLRRTVGLFLLGVAQRKAERTNSRIRREIQRLDQNLDKLFAFTGRTD